MGSSFCVRVQWRSQRPYLKAHNVRAVIRAPGYSIMRDGKVIFEGRTQRPDKPALRAFTLLSAHKVCYPWWIAILRGNHERHQVWQCKCLEHVTDLFDHFPLTALLSQLLGEENQM